MSAWNAAANFGGSALGSYLSYQAANKSAKAAKQNTLLQIAWEQHKAKNAHQWEVEDLKKAGLNPILSAGGSGANVGGISPQMPDFSGITSAGQLLGQGANNAVQAIIDAMNAKTNQDVGESQVSLNNAETAKRTIENKYINSEKKAEIANKKAETENINQDVKLKEATRADKIAEQAGRTESALAQGRIDVDSAKFLEQYGITKQQAVEIGIAGMRELMGLIKTGVSIFKIDQAKNQLLKRAKKLKNSAKNKNKNNKK